MLIPMNHFSIYIYLFPMVPFLFNIYDKRIHFDFDIENCLLSAHYLDGDVPRLPHMVYMYTCLSVFVSLENYPMFMTLTIEIKS